MRSPMLAFLATDVVGSSSRWETNPEGMSAQLQKHDQLIREAVERNEGRVVKGVGDGFFAVFSRATDALSSVKEIHQGLHAAEWNQTDPLQIRMAIHCGTAEQRDGDFFGNTVNRTARILTIAKPGQLVLSHAAYTLLEEDLAPDFRVATLGNQRLRGIGRPEMVYAISLPSLTEPGRKSRRIMRKTSDRGSWKSRRVVGVGAAMVCGVLAVGLVLLSQLHAVSAPPGKVTRASQSWVEDGYDTEHTGYDGAEHVLNPRRVAHLRVLWSLRGSSRTMPRVWSSVTVASDRVLVGSNAGTWALDASTGRVLWRNTRTGDTSASGPCVQNGSLFIGNAKGILYKLSLTDGHVDWMASTQPGISRPATLTSPSATGKLIFIGSMGESVWAFRDMFDHAKFMWTANQGTLTTSPVVANDTVYLGSNAGVQAVSSDAGTGVSSWGPGFAPLAHHFSAPSVADNHLYVNASVAGKKSRKGILYALRESNGTLLWRYPARGSASAPFTQPAVGGGFVYVELSSGRMLRLDENTGRVSWSFPANKRAKTGDRFWWRPSVADGVVYVGGVRPGKEDLYALDAANGRLILRFSRDDGHGVQVSASEPAISAGRVFISYSYTGSNATSDAPDIIAFGLGQAGAKGKSK